MESKEQLRKEFRRARKGLSEADHARLSAAACQRVMDSRIWQQADRVLVYAPLGAELNVWSLAETAWKTGKTVVFPKCCENPRTLAFFAVQSRAALRNGAWNILEPDENVCAAVDASAIDLAIVPVVGMDQRGIRLGNGGGYYDRVMKKFSCAVLIGFDEQLCECLPREPHDMTAHWLATPTQMIQVRD